MESMLFGGMLASLSTGLGALPVLFMRGITHRKMDILLAFTAGVMVAASTYGLIPAALKTASVFIVCVGVLFGAMTLSMLEQHIPHIDPAHTDTGFALDAKSVLVLAAMTLHNLPEGLSVGISYAARDETMGVTVTMAIGLQNAPEGLLIALFLANQRVNRWLALALALLTGATELLACWVGYELAQFGQSMVPYGLAFAAGSMLFIVYKELIPETHGHGHERAATFSFLFGLLAMICMMLLFT